jgi:hypothetical protein
VEADVCARNPDWQQRIMRFGSNASNNIKPLPDPKKQSLKIGSPKECIKRWDFPFETNNSYRT